jgi:hypothetical protein
MPKQKKPSKTRKLAPQIKEALRRSNEQSIRSIYESLIQYRQAHLRDCHISKCQECRDADVLIPYYFDRMKQLLSESK